MVIGKRNGLNSLVRRAGVFAGTFDPVHGGHISFALQAVKAGRLDVVYFLPERKPRSKQSPEHYAHRVAMLREALKPYKKLQILELPDTAFSVKRTLPELRAQQPSAEFSLLLGSDVVARLDSWPMYERLLEEFGVTVGLRHEATREEVLSVAAKWARQPKELVIIDSAEPEVSSSIVRKALRAGRDTKGVLASVAKYSKHQWLYASVPRKTRQQETNS